MRRRRSGLNFGRRKKKVNMTIVKEILSWTVEILITLVIAFTFVYFIGFRTSVVGQSMSETLESGDEILVIASFIRCPIQSRMTLLCFFQMEMKNHITM